MKQDKKFLLTAFFACNAFVAGAIPAMRGVWHTLTLADGSKVRAELRGDEYCSYWATADGTCYTLADNARQIYAKTDFNELAAKAADTRRAANAERAKRLAEARKGAARVGTPTGSFFGKKKGIVILVEFKDTKFGVGFNQKFVNGYVNGPLTAAHTRRGFVGTVKDYFLAQSNGQFELDFDVVGPYTLSKDVAYYGAQQGNSNDVRPGSMILEAVRAADADVNFADYDWTGNGEVDQVYVLYAGHGQADGSDSNTIWPHESTLEHSEVGYCYTSNDVDANGNKVTVNTYACGPELLLSKRAGIGTLCHEFAHCLGYPDLYDTTYSGYYGMGQYDLMDSGSYNGDSFCPPNFSAYEKWFAGWIEPTVLEKAATVKGVKAQDVAYGETYIIRNDATPDEYYLLENRQNSVGLWDTQLPASGLMITHVDYNKDVWSFNNVNSCRNYSKTYGQQYARFDSDHERLTIFCADNDRSSNTAGGDLYPYGGNNALTDTSMPASIIYNGGSHMGKPVTGITQNADGTIDLDFMGGSADNIITGVDGVAAVDRRHKSGIYSLDGRYLGNNINAVGKGVFIKDGKKIVK